VNQGNEIPFKIVYHDEVVRRDIPQLDRPIALRIRKAIESKLTASPENFGKPLSYTRKGLWALRIGDWRVVFAIRQGEVWVLRIGNRAEVYKDLDSVTDP